MNKQLMMGILVLLMGCGARGSEYLPSATTILGVSTIAYGTWNGIKHGIEWILPSRDDSHKAQWSDVLQGVVVPIATGTTLLMVRARYLGKK